jgi:hypothetical protein
MSIQMVRFDKLVFNFVNPNIMDNYRLYISIASIASLSLIATNCRQSSNGETNVRDVYSGLSALGVQQYVGVSIGRMVYYDRLLEPILYEDSQLRIALDRYDCQTGSFSVSNEIQSRGTLTVEARQRVSDLVNGLDKLDLLSVYTDTRDSLLAFQTDITDSSYLELIDADPTYTDLGHDCLRESDSMKYPRTYALQLLCFYGKDIDHRVVKYQQLYSIRYIAPNWYYRRVYLPVRDMRLTDCH